MANNPLLFNAAFAGAIGGAHTSRWITDPVAANYSADVAAAAAFAAIVDDNIPTDPDLNASDAALLYAICQAVIEAKSITTTSDSVRIAAAVIALWTAAEAGTEPIPAAIVAPLADTLFVDPDTLIPLEDQNGAIVTPFATAQQAHDAQADANGTIIICAALGTAGDLDVVNNVRIVGLVPGFPGAVVAQIGEIRVDSAEILYVDLQNISATSARLTGEQAGFDFLAKNCSIGIVDCGNGSCILTDCDVVQVGCGSFVGTNSSGGGDTISAQISAELYSGTYQNIIAPSINAMAVTITGTVTVDDVADNFSIFLGCRIVNAITNQARFVGGELSGITANAGIVPSTNILDGVTIPPGGVGISGDINTFIGCAIGNVTSGATLQEYTGCKWIDGTHSILCSSTGTIRFESSYLPNDLTFGGDSAIGAIETDQASWNNIVKLGLVLPLGAPAPTFFDLPDCVEDIGYTAAAPLVITILPAGHAPGLYNVCQELLVRTAATGISQLNRTFGYTAPIIGAISAAVNGATIINTGKAGSVSIFACRTTGATALTLTLTPNTVTGSPVVDSYCSAQLIANG